MRSLLLVFIGGGAGSVMRYLVSFYTQRWWTINQFPAGTLTVNILGCFLFGIFAEHLLKADSPLKMLLLAGFCGGFTTFSAFSAENYQLFQQGTFGLVLLNIILSILLGILAVWAVMRTAVLW